MSKAILESRRKFLRNSFGAVVMGTTLGSVHVEASPSVAGSETADATIVARVTLDRDLYDSDGVINGSISFRLPPGGDTVVQWIDSYGRVSGKLVLPPPAALNHPLPFSFRLAPGLTYRNWIRIIVNGVAQIEGAKFLLSPPPNPWDDYYAISWSHYPDGFYDLLRKSGINATIAYRSGDLSNVLDNDINFYVEQLAWEVFSIYHKDQPLWKGLIAQIQADRNNLKLWERKPCVNDPKTDEYLRTNLAQFVREHRAFRPLYYNIADELGQGDQIKPNDFCHSEHCTIKFAEYLRGLYRTPGNVEREWQAGMEMTHWDDASVRSGAEWEKRDLMISFTTTDHAFDTIAVAGFSAKYGSVAELNKQWGTSFPVRRRGGSQMNMHDEWLPVIGLVRDVRSIVNLNEEELEHALGPLPQANSRWGLRAGWQAVQKPTNFQTWSQVLDFLNRFYKELGEIRSTDHWNVAAWCDFRNFMDSTFADAVRRAALVCKAEDPDARCGTEGGQCPFAFGWYNYEQVLKAVDVIEPYNIGNNVEVIRSLKPSTIMLSTHGYQYQPGQPLTDEDRLVQKRAGLSIWWGIFHGHRANIIWDANLKNYAFVDEKTRELTPAAEAFTKVFNELQRGIPKLIYNSRRTHDGIAIHYSQPSIQIHWLLDNLKYAREWMAHSGGDRDSHIVAVRNSWTKLIEDLGLQYNFVSNPQVEAGKLGSGEYRAFIMPQSVAISEHEAQQIREFVRGGGLLIADYRTATMNEHGRDLGRGQLDDVFGISRGQAQTAGQTARGVGDEGSLRLQGKELKLVKPGDEAVKATSGKALAASGEAPLVIVNQFGSGRAVFLNLEVADYAYQRLQASLDTSLPELVESVLGLAQISPRVQVLGPDGKRLPGAEVVIFANGACEQVAIFRNPQFDDGGWGGYPTMKERGWAGSIDNSLFEKEVQVNLVWDDTKQTYDVRARQDLGAIKNHKAALDPWEPLVFTRSTQPLPKFQLTVPSVVKAGEGLNVTLQDEASLPEGTIRIVRLEFTDPAGEIYALYSRNLLVRSTPHQEIVPIAFSDPKGRWRAQAHDIMTGQVVEASFNLG